MRRMSSNRSRRAAFTLVELLVVIGIVLVLATMVVALTPRAYQNQKAANGASLLQTWLRSASHLALREKVAHGVRLLPDANMYVTELQFIEQPRDFYYCILNSVDTTLDPTRKTIVCTNIPGEAAIDFYGGYGPSADATKSLAVWPVQPGDFLDLMDGGTLYKISQVQASTTTPTISDRLQLQYTPIPGTLNLPWLCRIVRAPRPLVGSQPLRLPQDVVIDLSNSQIQPESRPDGSSVYDILFSPSVNSITTPGQTSPGGVIRMGRISGKVILWVRDITLDNPTDGNPTLITVYTRTGFVAAHPVDPTDYFRFTRDNQSSGL